MIVSNLRIRSNLQSQTKYLIKELTKDELLKVEKQYSISPNLPKKRHTKLV